MSVEDGLVSWNRDKNNKLIFGKTLSFSLVIPIIIMKLLNLVDIFIH